MAASTQTASEIEELRQKIASLQVHGLMVVSIGAWLYAPSRRSTLQPTDRPGPTSQPRMQLLQRAPPRCIWLQLAHCCVPVPCARQADLQEKEAKVDLVHPYSKTYGRAMISSILGMPDGGKSLVGGVHAPAQLQQQLKRALTPVAAAWM
jgi:hypothetical protein